MTIAILLYQGIEIYSKRMKIKKLSVDAVHEISDKHHRRDTATSVQAVAPLPSIVATRADNGPGNASTFESQPSSGDVQPLGEGDTSANERTPPKTDLSTRETPERTPETTPESARSNINHGQLPTRKPSTLTLGPTFYATGAAQDESRSNYEQHGTPVSSGTTDARRNDLGLDELENRSAASSAPTAYAQVRSHDGASLGPTRTSSLSQNRTWRTRLPILRPLQTADRHTATYFLHKHVVRCYQNSLRRVPCKIPFVYRGMTISAEISAEQQLDMVNQTWDAFREMAGMGDISGWPINPTDRSVGGHSPAGGAVATDDTDSDDNDSGMDDQASDTKMGPWCVC
ncbi:hypothetical protein RJZ90_007947 [Blastomyces dermatitidis]